MSLEYMMKTQMFMTLSWSLATAQKKVTELSYNSNHQQGKHLHNTMPNRVFLKHDLVYVPFLSSLCWSLTFIFHENYIIWIISLLLSCPFFHLVVKIGFLILKSVTMSDKVNTFISASCSGLRKLFLYCPYIIFHISIIYKC